MKRCIKCGLSKPWTEFYKATSARDGLRPECKDCAKVLRHERYMRDRAENIERVRAWRRANPERYKETQARYRKLRVSEQRADHLRRAYGLTVEAYESLLASQDGGCAICGREPKRIALHVDHDHGTGTIRGLLCVGCNNALGQFKDSPELLSRAIAYLQEDLLTLSATADLVDQTLARAGELRRTSV